MDTATGDKSLNLMRPPTLYTAAGGKRVTRSTANMVTVDEPSSYKEAMSGGQAEAWKDAIAKELESLEKHGVWSLEDLPPGRRAIGCKWVFKTKRDQHGDLVKHKARLVAQGFSQQEGVDYKETFAPVAKATTIKTLLAYAAMKGLLLKQYDVETAFLYGDLEEEIYMRAPDGVVTNGQVCRLKKALYGLKQAGRQWNTHFTDSLLSMGFEQLKQDVSVFKMVDEDSLAIVVIYVDDIILATKSNSKVPQQFMDNLGKRYKIKDCGLLRWYLGMEIKQDKDSIAVNQRQYTLDILKRFGMEECKPARTPMAVAVSIEEKENPDHEMTGIPYMNAVGALIYLTVLTRPDLAFAVSKVAQHNQNPTMEAWTAVKRIFRYLKGTLELGLLYGTGGEALVAYCDADHAGDRADRKSTSGYAIFFGGGPIAWYSKKQTCIASSTCEAEYVACAEVSRQIKWIKELLMELGHDVGTTEIFCDNLGAIRLAGRKGPSERTKHIDLQYHVVQDFVQRKVIRLQYVDTEQQVADIFTKALPEIKHRHHRDKLMDDAT